MGGIASQITSLTIVYSTIYSDADQRNHQISAPLAFVRGIHRGPVNSQHKWPVTQKMFPFDDVIMCRERWSTSRANIWRYSVTWYGVHHEKLTFQNNVCNIIINRTGSWKPKRWYKTNIHTVCLALLDFYPIPSWQWDDAMIVPVKYAESCAFFRVCTVTEMDLDIYDINGASYKSWWKVISCKEYDRFPIANFPYCYTAGSRLTNEYQLKHLPTQ